MPRPFAGEHEITQWGRIKALYPDLQKVHYAFVFSHPFGGMFDDAVLENFPLFMRMTTALSENGHFELDEGGLESARALSKELDKKCAMHATWSITVT